MTDFVSDLERALKPTTSKKKRKMCLANAKKRLDVHSVVFDTCFEDSFGKRDADGFLQMIYPVQENIETDIPRFLDKKEREALPKINAELIEFYDKHRDGDKGVAELIRRLNNRCKFVFEFPMQDSASFLQETSWPITKDRPIGDINYDFRGLAQKADYMIMYHGTCTRFDAAVEQDGLQPPSSTGLDYNKMLEHIKGLILNKFEEHEAEERFAEFKATFEKSRKDSVYISTARSANLKGDRFLYTNGEVHGFMARAIELFGGDMRAYRCIAETSRLLPDEDVPAAKDWIESVYDMNSARVVGGIQPDHVFNVKDNCINEHAVKSETALAIQKIFNNEHEMFKAYIKENPGVIQSA